MELINLPRGQGKTTKLVQWATDPNRTEDRTLLVPSAHTAAYVRSLARALGAPMVSVVPVSQWDHSRTGRIGRLGVDDIDQVLTEILNCSVRIGSLSPDRVGTMALESAVDRFAAITDDLATTIRRNNDH